MNDQERAERTMHHASLSIRPAAFFALTFVLSWLIWIPLVLSHFAIGPLSVPEGTSNLVRLFGVLMPATAALLLARRARRGGARSVLGRLTIWRVGWRWWAAAVLVQPALLVLTGLVYNLLGGEPPVTPDPALTIPALLVNVVFLLLATLGEEIGWRGVALPSLQARTNALSASAILGLLWAIWHLPFWLLLDTFDQFGVFYLILNVLLIFPSTFFITWFFNRGCASLLLPVGFHVTFNIVNTALFPVTAVPGAFAVFIGLQWAIAIAVIRDLEPQKRAGGDVSITAP